MARGPFIAVALCIVLCIAAQKESKDSEASPSPKPAPDKPATDKDSDKDNDKPKPSPSPSNSTSANSSRSGSGDKSDNSTRPAGKSGSESRSGSDSKNTSVSGSGNSTKSPASGSGSRNDTEKKPLPGGADANRTSGTEKKNMTRKSNASSNATDTDRQKGASPDKDSAHKDRTVNDEAKAGVKVLFGLTITNVDFNKLADDDKAQMIGVFQTAAAEAAEPPVPPEEVKVRLSAGSVKVEIEVMTARPSGSQPNPEDDAQIAAQLAARINDQGPEVMTAILKIDGVQDAFDGPEGETITFSESTVSAQSIAEDGSVTDISKEMEQVLEQEHGDHDHDGEDHEEEAPSPPSEEQQEEQMDSPQPESAPTPSPPAEMPVESPCLEPSHFMPQKIVGEQCDGVGGLPVKRYCAQRGCFDDPEKGCQCLDVSSCAAMGGSWSTTRCAEVLEYMPFYGVKKGTTVNTMTCSLNGVWDPDGYAGGATFKQFTNHMAERCCVSYPSTICGAFAGRIFRIFEDPHCTKASPSGYIYLSPTEADPKCWKWKSMDIFFKLGCVAGDGQDSVEIMIWEGGEGCVGPPLPVPAAESLGLYPWDEAKSFIDGQCVQQRGACDGGICLYGRLDQALPASAYPWCGAATTTSTDIPVTSWARGSVGLAPALYLVAAALIFCTLR